MARKPVSSIEHRGEAQGDFRGRAEGPGATRRGSHAGGGRAFREKVQRDAIVIGRDIIRKEGLAALQARRIASDAGCSVGSIYNVFGDLDGLIIALNQRTLEELGAELKAAHAKHLEYPLHERLLALAETYFAFAATHSRTWRAIFEHSLPEGRSAPPEYRQDQDRLFALIEDCLRPVIEDGGERHSAARALFASVHGIVLLSLDQKLGLFDAEATRRQIAFLVGCASGRFSR